MKNTVIGAIVILLLISGVGWFTMSKDKQNRNTGENPAKTDTMPATVSDTPGATIPADLKNGAALEISVEGSEFKFAPSTITVKKGQTVKLTLKNTGKMPHDFVIDELNVRTKKITGTTTDVIEFTPDKTGTFEYYCSVGSHRAMGMKGTLTVTE